MSKKILFVLLSSSVAIPAFLFSQNIAVNTTGTAAAATNMFEVTQSSTTNNTVGLFSRHSGAATNAYAIWAEVTGATNKYAIIVPSGGGYVGIGTSTPTRWLQVEGSGAGLHTASFLNTTGYGLAIGSTTGSAFGSIQAYSNSSALAAPLILQGALGGNVGIATTNPEVLLHAVSSIPTSTTNLHPYQAGAIVEGDQNTFGGRISIRQASETPSLTLFRTNGTIAAPTTLISGDVMGRISFGGYDGSVVNSFGGIDAVAAENWTSSAHGSHVIFKTVNIGGGWGGTEKMRLTSEGNLGLSTTTPGTITGWTQPANMRVFEISGDGTTAGTFTDGVIIMSNNRATATLGDQVGSLLFAHKNNPGNFPAAITSYLTGSGGVNGFGARLEFHTKADNVAGHLLRMTIDQSGNVGIGTAPSTRLHVAGGPVLAQGLLETAYTAPATVSNATYLNYYYAANNWAGIGGYTNGAMWYRAQDHVFWTPGTLVGSPTYVMIFNQAGDVGIGTASPGGQLELTLDEGRKPGTNTWTITSDARLKNIEGAYKKGLSEILQLNPITYHYKNTGERKFADEVISAKQVGFSAQEVQKIFPESVGTDKDGYLNFNMHAILVAYVNAIKEQQKLIEELTQKVNDLEKKLNASGTQPGLKK